MGASLARTAVQALQAHQFDIAFVLGDLSNNGDAPSLDEAIAAIGGLDAPTLILSGNHDLRVSERALRDAVERTSESMRIPDLPGERFRDNFIVAGLRFTGVADLEVDLLERPDVEAWGDDPVLLLSHYPIISRMTAAARAGWKYAGDPQGLNGLADRLAARTAPTIAFHGHLHLSDAVARGAYLQLGFPALVENGHNVALVEVDGDASAMTVKVSNLSTSGDERPAAAIGVPASRWRLEEGRWHC